MSPSENYRLAAGQLLDCWLSQVEFGENPTFGSAPREPITYNITHQHEVEISEADGDDGQSLATLRVKVDVEWLHQDGVEDVEKPFALSLSVVGRFGWDKAVHDR